MDPVTNITADRAQARKRNDTNADVCFLALSDAEGNASVRTLVLRDIIDNVFTLFINKSSPKWRIIEAGGTHQMLIWYSTMQRQYRVSGEFREIARDTIERNWLRRPIASKYLDHVYEDLGAQSSVIESREVLTDKINQLKKTMSEDQMQTPALVSGVELIANRIEMLDLGKEDRIHERRVFHRENGLWNVQVIIP